MERLVVKKGMMNELYKVSHAMRTRLWVLCIAAALVFASAPADAAETPEVAGAYSFVLDGTLIAKRKSVVADAARNGLDVNVVKRRRWL